MILVILTRLMAFIANVTYLCICSSNNSEEVLNLADSQMEMADSQMEMADSQMEMADSHMEMADSHMEMAPAKCDTSHRICYR